MRVRALKDMYDGVSTHKEGEEYDYTGAPNANLLPLDQPKTKAAPVEDDEDDEPSKKYSKHK